MAELSSAGSTLRQEHVTALRALCNRFGEPFTGQKKDLLQQMAGLALADVAPLLQYHDCLLFMLAYPENRELLGLCTTELERVVLATTQHAKGGNHRKSLQTIRSGVHGTLIQGAFSFTFVQWLLKRYPQQVSFHSFGAEEEKVKAWLKLTVPLMERDLIADDALSIEEWISTSKGSSKLSDLEWLMQQLERLQMDAEQLDIVYDSLQLFINWNLTGESPSRSFTRAAHDSIYYHREPLKKHVDAAKLITSPVTKEIKLDRAQTTQLVEAARGALAMLNRETDTLTYTNLHEVYYLDMGRGIRIALFGLQPARRLSVDTYIGYMAFKNGVPMAYGGAWPFLQSAKIGLNIFAPFRGGESAWLFCQLMRAYHHLFGVQRFTVETYQIGRNNMEAIRSGAFWFYYRMGFRPVEKEMYDLAQSEAARIASQPGYRSPENVLKKLANSNIAFTLPRAPKDAGYYEVTQLNSAVTKHIATVYHGDRNLAVSQSAKRVGRALALKKGDLRNGDETRAFESLSLLLNLVADLQHWPAKDKQQLLQLVKAKGGTREADYARLLKAFTRLQKSLAQIAQNN